MTAAQTAVVIGGGIAGPVTAMALQRAGIQATVHEAYASAADGVGGMLGLAPNGLDALAAMDLDGPVRRVGVGDGSAKLNGQAVGNIRRSQRQADHAPGLASRSLSSLVRRGEASQDHDRALASIR